MKSGKNKNMAMRLKTKNECAGERQQQFIGLTNRTDEPYITTAFSFKFHMQMDNYIMMELLYVTVNFKLRRFLTY